MPEVNAAASLGIPTCGLRNRTHERGGVQRIEHKAGFSGNRVRERGNHQSSLGSQRLQQRVHHRFGATGNVSQAAQRAVHHNEAAAGDAEAGEVANERGSVERLDALPTLRLGIHPVPIL